ncbi:GH92 family glycosyl hydrolase [Catenulispora yoronensis]|uniref:GH92 family glycosyl hydrolase n=1 Tax=Catenulispora yoronensis TaxID=450799 RepID=A0ABP5EZH3_9ACTN
MALPSPRRSRTLIRSFVAGATLVAAAAFPSLTSVAHAATLVSDPASLVDARIMTSGGGNDFPGADVPFGMVQWSPDTATGRNDGGGYDYGASQIRGFGLTHMAGPGCGAMGDLPILPLTGALPSGDPGAHMESFTHTGEVATAGYYSVNSGSSAIKTELTATQRSGMARFTFPATTQADLLVKLLDSQNNTSASSAQIVSNTEISGTATSGGFCGEAGSYTVHFDMVFDQPFTASQIVNEGQSAGPNSVFLTFNTSSNHVVQAKVGVSFVSTANAKANWQAENSGFDFNATQTAAHNSWNTLLNKVQVGGGTAAQQQLFYTSLYHVLLHPNVVSDTNGQYMGFDNAVHTASSGHAQYDQFSGWDVYHAQTQLSALVAPVQTSDIAQSLVNDYAQGGTFPQWGFMNFYNWVMAGDPATAALANYYAFGATNFDTATALSDMLQEATTNNNVRRGTTLENQYGYLPDDLYNGNLGCCNVHGSAASLLEYDQADFALSRFASSLGDSGNATTFASRANNWKHIFNTANGLINPKNSNGSWVSISPTSSNGFIEGSAAQYRFVVPFDQPAEAALLGGNSATNSLLDSFFTTMDGSNGNQSFLSNEFDLGTPWFYNWTGAPSHTQSVVNRMLNQFYKDTPTSAAFPNNDDLGTMSAQYVWGALGMYPVTPGSGDLMFNSPIFTQAVVHLPSGNTMTINAPAASASNYYVQSLNVNGAASTKNWMSQATWKNGVTLDFTLGSAASSWGSGAADAPPAYDSGTNPTSHTGPVTSGIAGKCLDDNGGSTVNGTKAQIWDCNGTGAQQWTSTGGTLQVNGKCLDVTGAGTANGTLVEIWDCNGGGNQQWQQNGNTLVNPASGRCLDDPGFSATNGTQVEIWDCNGGVNQQWTLS